MPDRSQPPARSASYGQLYIVVNRFDSLEDLSLPFDNSFFKARNLWSIVTQRRRPWCCGNPCIKITGQRFAIERPERQHLYFQVASFESDLQEYVEEIVSFTDLEDADDPLKCNRKWVRDALGKLVTGGILSREKVYDALSELEMISKEIELH